MSEVSGSALANERSIGLSVFELEADGMVSVYVNGKFAWQLPQKLLSEKVPTAKSLTALTSNVHTVWNIEKCSKEGFRLFAEWLYSPHGQLKEPVEDTSITPYLDLSKLASQNGIYDLARTVGKMVKDQINKPSNMELMGEIYEGLPVRSPDRAVLSANYAALIVSKTLERQDLQSLLNSSDLARDVLVWIVVYNQHAGDTDGHQEVLAWMAQKVQLWIDAHE